MSDSTSEIHSRRPTSPHLSIYNWQISNSLSILHRLTGVAIFYSMSFICWWGILSVFSGYNPAITFFGNTIYFKLIIIVTVAPLLFHLATGIRHLFWDAGYGFSIKVMTITGFLAVFTSLLLTAFLYYYILGQ